MIDEQCVKFASESVLFDIYIIYRQHWTQPSWSLLLDRGGKNDVYVLFCAPHFCLAWKCDPGWDIKLGPCRVKTKQVFDRINLWSSERI